MAPLKVEEKGLIFIPVNNNTSIESAGGNLPFKISLDRSSICFLGSHWALLVFRRETGKFEFYDSYNNGNLKSAKAIAQKIQPLLAPEQKEAQVECRATPQQQNGSVS